MNFHRWTQIFCLILFLSLLIYASTGTLSELDVDFFIRLDPSVALVTALSSRFVSYLFIPAIIVLLLTIGLGRFFCGYICPMGTTLDGADKLFGIPFRHQKNWPKLKRIKYLVALFLIGSAAFGVSYIFAASPLSLITRFYGLLIFSIFKFLGINGQRLLMPLLESLDFSYLIFLEIKPTRFATQFFILFFFMLLFALPRLTPRFWCRYVCPAGAIMALFSFKPILRRQVDSSCNNCGKCIRSCTMGAIYKTDPAQTRHEECVACLSCQRACPENSIAFGNKRENRKLPSHCLPSRRQFIFTGMAGAGTAIVSLTGLTSVYGKPDSGRVAPPLLIRPPAALPESEFLSRCIRCGECMVACPTNTLQPLWFKAGMMGLFSPAMVPRRGFCDPSCHRCAQVCPTAAINDLTSSERLWAKTGTAIIHRNKCLAWEYGRKCMVCDEVCPFAAIEFTREPGIGVTVPKVLEHRCAGCGYCEHHCPVQNQSAIIVSPMNEIRLKEGSYQIEARKRGLIISRRQSDLKITYPSDSGESLPPGFEHPPLESQEKPKSSLPPGFSE